MRVIPPSLYPFPVIPSAVPVQIKTNLCAGGKGLFKVLNSVDTKNGANEQAEDFKLCNLENQRGGQYSSTCLEGINAWVMVSAPRKDRNDQIYENEKKDAVLVIALK